MSILKEVFAPHLNRNVKFGRKIPPVVGPHLKLRNYLRASLPSPPTSLDLSKPALSCLTNVEQNDVLGDCVIAGKTHIDGVLTGNAGKLVSASAAQVLSQYEAIGGYKPGDPSTDQGCNIQDAMNYWVKNPGPTGTKLTAWLGVDPTNESELKAAQWLFNNLYFGMALPDAWITPFPSGNGFVWDVAGKADPSNGHCVMGYGYTSSGVSIDSWGLFGTLTWKAIAEYAANANSGELYVLLSTDELISGQQLAPNGVNWSSLISDWNSIGGSVTPLPTPAPTPVPPAPKPGTEVTLAQAEAWIKAGFSGHPMLLTASQAEALAVAGLSKNWPKS